MFKIKQKIGISISIIIVIALCNLKVEAQVDKTYEIIKEVAKLNSYKLNRNVEFDINLITKYCTIENFQFSIYKGLEKVNSINDFSSNDIKELKANICCLDYPSKWKKSFLLKYNIKTTAKKIGNKIGKPLFILSPPIFFKNNMFVLIYVRTWCGFECGEESLKIFKLMKNEIYEYYGEILISIS